MCLYNHHSDLVTVTFFANLYVSFKVRIEDDRPYGMLTLCEVDLDIETGKDIFFKYSRIFSVVEKYLLLNHHFFSNSNEFDH